ncbi:hypothetical protein [Lactobacillus taiwanensis]|uniref:hypothetical protein n=1 Tax=Lactobacillus taiwanensis TaxID=508451 RepID=UPI00321FE068
MVFTSTSDLIGESSTQEKMIDAMAKSLDDMSIETIYEALPKSIQEKIPGSVPHEGNFDFYVIQNALELGLFWKILEDLDKKDDKKQCKALKEMAIDKPDKDYLVKTDRDKYFLEIYYIAKFERQHIAYVRAYLRTSWAKALEVRSTNFPLSDNLEKITEWVNNNMTIPYISSMEVKKLQDFCEGEKL